MGVVACVCCCLCVQPDTLLLPHVYLYINFPLPLVISLQNRFWNFAQRLPEERGTNHDAQNFVPYKRKNKTFKWGIKRAPRASAVQHFISEVSPS